ncbi:MAG TPA: DUF4142 domain-containing protein [Gemmatimonadaceae bacterium]|nr:DUF4142 domain-containing protein [Gemmatimonadaceae bacterium]
MSRISNFPRVLAAAALAVSLTACERRGDEVAVDTTVATRTDTAMTASTGTLDRDMSDAGIVGLLNAANSGEVEAANLALTKAKNARVREFAQTMKRDHTALRSKVEQLGQSLNVTPVIPRDEDELVKDHREDMEELAKDDDDFDKEYIDAEIEAHENTLDVIDKALQNTQTAQVRTLLQQARPNVEAHLTLARQIKDAID